MRIAVIGGGIVGLATAYRLVTTRTAKSVVVLEKEARVGQHQSGHNSGVLHAGLYYSPGSEKARLAVTGIRLMTAYARQHGIAHEICGKVVVATDDTQVPRLRALAERGSTNGLAGLKWLDRAELRRLEPHCAGVAALHVPEEGIIDYHAVCESLQCGIAAAGGRVETGFSVTALVRRGSEWIITNGKREVVADFLIGCAGLYADRVARLAGARPDVKIVPFRGEYYRLGPAAADLVRNLIYPVPDPVFPFLGVHFTRLISGGVEAGPNAVLALAREGYSWRDFSAGDAIESLSYPGLWRFLATHARMCASEIQRSLSIRLFGDSLRMLVPEVRDVDLLPGGAGVRAQAMDRNGRLVQDFAFHQTPGALHVLNAPSPAATASLAIADEIVNRIQAA